MAVYQLRDLTTQYRYCFRSNRTQMILDDASTPYNFRDPKSQLALTELFGKIENLRGSISAADRAVISNRHVLLSILPSFLTVGKPPETWSACFLCYLPLGQRPDDYPNTAILNRRFLSAGMEAFTSLL
ncbi:hypothetical protein WAI453_002733 [Rhynchosporium graminicola]